MCRSTDFHGYNLFDRNHHRLKIEGFYVRFSIFKSCCRPLPESLTLAYLPRINGSFLEIDGAKVRPDTTAFVTLHRVVLAGSSGIVVFASRERVRASEGVRFEVFLGEEKVLKGIFRKDEDNEWNMECKCGLESGMASTAAVEVSEAEVCVAVVGHVAMSEKVEMVVKKKKKKKKAKKCFQRLEEIPEEREGEEVAESDETSDGCDCCCLCREEGYQCGSDGGDDDEGSEEMEEMEMDMEGVRWAVDVGILVMSLGLGYLVSKAASSKSLRRRRIL